MHALRIANTYSNVRGFTLTELMITLAIVAIVLTAAVPSFQNFVLDNRLTTQANDLIADLTFARSEAVKRSGTVRVCVKESAAEACDTTTPAWGLNRIIWVDANSDNIINAGEILRRRERLDGDNVLLASNIPDILTFGREGFTNVASPATGLSNHFKLCDRRKDAFARAILVDRSGRVRTSREASFLTDSAQTNFLTCPDV